jgi:hypothetical protein
MGPRLISKRATEEMAPQTFMKSAQYAGFIDSATGRFVKPGIVQRDETPPPKPDVDRGGNSGDGTGGLSLLPGAKLNAPGRLARIGG